MSRLQVVVFNLNDQICGADTSQVLEIIKYQDLSSPPKLPEFIDGFIQLRGMEVPVINLNKRFDLGETEYTRKSKVIVTQVDGRHVGYLINDVIEITGFSEEEVGPVPGCIRSKGNLYIKSIGKKEDQLISILDLSRILTETEIKSLAG